jgi:hypothetical protein
MRDDRKAFIFLLFARDMLMSVLGVWTHFVALIGHFNPHGEIKI